MTQNPPDGYTTVAPWVVTDDTGRFLDFVTEVFDGHELARVALEDGSIGHGETRVGDTVVLAFDRQDGWPAWPSLLRVFVPDADRAFARATAAGSVVVTELDNNAFGQRGGRVRDPFGNIWWIVSHVEDVPEDVMWQRMTEPSYAENMRVAQTTLDAELSGRACGRSSSPVRGDTGNDSASLDTGSGRTVGGADDEHTLERLTYADRFAHTHHEEPTRAIRR